MKDVVRRNIYQTSPHLVGSVASLQFRFSFDSFRLSVFKFGDLRMSFAEDLDLLDSLRHPLPCFI